MPTVGTVKREERSHAWTLRHLPGIKLKRRRQVPHQWMSGNHSGIMTRSAYCTNIKCRMVTSDSKASECSRCYAPLTDDIERKGVYYSPEELAEFKEWVEQ